MEIAVRYYTRSGNTEKLARAIGAAAGVEAQTIDHKISRKTDLLFLGCSYYAFDVDPQVKAFVMENREMIGRIVCFGTSAMMKSVYKPMQKVAREAGVALSREEFHCRGSFKFANKGRPNADDLESARNFARKLVEGK